MSRLGASAADEAAPVYRADRLPNRWGLRNPPATKTDGPSEAEAEARPVFAIPFAERIGRTALVVGTFDTKGAELRFIRDRLRALGIPVRTVDLSTSGKISRADVTPMQVAAMHPHGSSAVFSGDRGESVAAMADAFGRWIERERGIGGVISAGGSGGTSLATAGMRRLPLGIPKIMVSTVASGEVGRYVGPADIMMLHSVADVQGLNPITEQILGNAAHALAGMISGMPTVEARETRRRLARPAVGITMFGVTTPAVQAISKRLEVDFDCLVFHATGVGGRSMESLGDSGMLSGFIDLTTTEVADMLVGGVFAADADRFGAPIRTGLPYVGSVGAMDMVNFGPRETVPERFRSRRLVVHNPNVTLMRTTRDENRAIGEWMGSRINQMEGPVRLLLPEGGVSMLDAPGKAFHDPEADNALFESLEKTVRQNARRKIERVDANINDEKFVASVVDAFGVDRSPQGKEGVMVSFRHCEEPLRRSNAASRRHCDEAIAIDGAARRTASSLRSLTTAREGGNMRQERAPAFTSASQRNGRCHGVTSDLLSVFPSTARIEPGFTTKYAVDRLVYFEMLKTWFRHRARKADQGWIAIEKAEIDRGSNPQWRDLFEELFDGDERKQRQRARRGCP